MTATAVAAARAASGRGRATSAALIEGRHMGPVSLGGTGPLPFNGGMSATEIRLPSPPLSDGVVTLRRLQERDRAAVLAGMDDPLVRRWLNMPDIPEDRHFDELLRTVDDGWAAGTRCDLVIANRRDTWLGAVIASRRHRDNWELAYLAGAPGRGQGLVTRAVHLVCNWLFEAGVGRIEIRSHPENVPSQRVAERCGFQREGRERRSIWLHGRRQDAVLWSLLPDDAR